MPHSWPAPARLCRHSWRSRASQRPLYFKGTLRGRDGMVATEVTMQSAEAIAELLLKPLSRVLVPDALAWLTVEIDRQRSAANERGLAIAIGLASRKIGRVELSLTAEEVAAARRLRAGWEPELWTADEA